MPRIFPFHLVRSSGLGLASPLRVQWIQLEQGGAQITELGAWGPSVLLEGHSGVGLTNVNESQVGWVIDGSSGRSQWEEPGKGKLYPVLESQTKPLYSSVLTARVGQLWDKVVISVRMTKLEGRFRECWMTCICMMCVWRPHFILR